MTSSLPTAMRSKPNSENSGGKRIVASRHEGMKDSERHLGRTTVDPGLRLMLADTVVPNNGQHRRVGDSPAIKRGTLVAKRPRTIGKQTLPISGKISMAGATKGPAPHRSCELRTFEPNDAPKRQGYCLKLM